MASETSSQAKPVSSTSYMVWQGAHGQRAADAAQAQAGYEWLSSHNTGGSEVRAIEYATTTHAFWTRESDGVYRPAQKFESIVRASHPRDRSETTVWFDGHGKTFSSLEPALRLAADVAAGRVAATDYAGRRISPHSIEVQTVSPRDIAGPRAVQHEADPGRTASAGPGGKRTSAAPRCLG